MRAIVTLTAAAALVLAFGLTGTAKAEVFFPFDTDLVAYWPFDDDSAADQAPAGSVADDGTFEGGAAVSADVPPVVPNTKSVDLDGTGDFIAVAGDSADLDQAGDFSIAAWVALDVDKGVNAILEKVNVGNTTRNYEVLVWAQTKPNKVTFAVTFDDTVAVGPESPASGTCDVGNKTCWVTGGTTFVDGGPHPLGTWRHIAGVYDNTAKTLKVYLDGVLDGTHTIVTTGIPEINDEILRIGSRKTFAADDVNGRIDEVRIYDVALSDDDIATLHSSVAVFKELVSATDGGDDVLALKEEWEFVMKVTVANNTSQDLTNASLRDPLPGDLELGDETSGTGASACPDDVSVLLVDDSGAPGKDVNTSPTTITRGNADKCIIDWDIVSGAAGDDKLAPGDFVMLTITASTDVNPAGIRKGDAVTFHEYTSGTTHCINQGAKLTGTLSSDGLILVRSNGLEVSIGDTLPDDVDFVTHDDCD